MSNNQKNNDSDEFDHYRNLGLNPDNVPATLRSLIPLAEKWGIPDDVAREDFLNQVSTAELRQLVSEMSQYDESLFDDWLAGNEAYSESVSREYVSFTELRDAYEGAVFLLENRDDSTV